MYSHPWRTSSVSGRASSKSTMLQRHILASSMHTPCQEDAVYSHSVSQRERERYVFSHSQRPYVDNSTVDDLFSRPPCRFMGCSTSTWEFVIRSRRNASSILEVFIRHNSASWAYMGATLLHEAKHSCFARLLHTVYLDQYCLQTQDERGSPPLHCSSCCIACCRLQLGFYCTGKFTRFLASVQLH